jgi:beta-lactam-binding protein with PASTA domain
MRVRSFVFYCFALVVLMGLAAGGVFFFSVQGAEETMVPDVRGQELTAGLLELQVKELYPRIQLQYSQSTNDKGLILDQDPPPGTIVKAGRRIRLVVSQGVVLNTVDTYIGRNVDEVKLDIRTIFASVDKPLLTLVEPYMYEYSSEAPGTILQQSPEPGTPLSGPTELSVVVSRGPEFVSVSIPSLTGQTPSDAVAALQKAGLRFSFSIRALREGETPGLVVYQNPSAGSTSESGRSVSLLVPFLESAPHTAESLAGDAIVSSYGDVSAYGLFSYTLPENPYPLSVRLEALYPEAETRTLLLACNFSGGEFTFPYQVPAGTTLIFSQLDREIYREVISGE